MKSLFCCLFFTLPLILFSQELKTPMEISGPGYTGTYEEVIEFYRHLDEKFSVVKMIPIGETDAGEPLHLVMLDTDKNFDAEKAKKDGKSILLINNGIHPGEPDGIEASMKFLRDAVESSRFVRDFKDLFIAVIPIYNVGGALNRNTNSRANQEGPEAYGFRGNAQNRDLNRDFIKMDTKNARTFARIFHMLNPDMFIDTHVSNGADYQYSITHLATQPDKLGGELGKYMQITLIPTLENKMEEKGSEIIPYVNSFGTTPDKGYGIFFDAPRYSTGYTTLFNTLGFMIETHMLKPFPERVEATYHFIGSACDILREDGDEISRMRKDAHSSIRENGDYIITWNRNREKSREITFKGYEGVMTDSYFGGNRLFYDRNSPFEKTIPYYDRFDPGIAVGIPEAYVIPQGWHQVIDRLRINRINLLPLRNDTTIEVEAYRIEDVSYSQRPYEGHFPHRDVTLSKSMKKISFRAGDFLVPTDQDGIRFLIEVLEPQATDSYFKWNFFDAVLQQKEYFSAYVFEDIAKMMLESDPQLKERFEEAVSQSESMAGNRRAQLDWIYRNSSYYETAHLNYPVYRILK